MSHKKPERVKKSHNSSHIRNRKIKLFSVMQKPPSNIVHKHVSLCINNIPTSSVSSSEENHHLASLVALQSQRPP